MKQLIKAFLKETIKPILETLLYPIKLFFEWMLDIEDEYLVPIYIKLFPDADPLKYLFISMGVVSLILIIYLIFEDCNKD